MTIWCLLPGDNHFSDENVMSVLLQLGEEQLKALLERVSEKTGKTTTVKVVMLAITFRCWAAVSKTACKLKR
jgi:hypothetical protein